MSGNSSSSSLDYLCVSSDVSLLLNNIFIIVRCVLIIPLSVLVFYLGCRKWRRQHSFSAMSHVDVFTYNMAAMELISILGSSLFICGLCTDLQQLIEAGICLSSITYVGEIIFHLLTILERYYAVVHPITYLGLRKKRWVRIRGVSVGCVWLLSSTWVGVTKAYYPQLATIPYLIILVFSLVVVSFCSLSVLYALIPPAPGHRGGDKERVDQTKRRAFFTITAIMAVMGLWLVGIIVSVVIEISQVLDDSTVCLMMLSLSWLHLPTSLVLPLLHLHRSGKLTCCTYSQ